MEGEPQIPSINEYNPNLLAGVVEASSHLRIIFGSRFDANVPTALSLALAHSMNASLEISTSG